MTMDQYTFLWVFAAGVLVQALLIVREPRRMAGVLGLAAVALAGAWFMADPEDDLLFQVALFTTLAFVVLFAFAYRDVAMPHISRRALLHYSLIWYYGVWLSAQAAPIEVPAWVYIAAAVPVALAAVVGFWPREPWRWVRVLMYVWFLVVMMFVLGGQFSGDRLQEIYDASGFSLELYAYGFVTGAVFLLFGLYFIYATMLLMLRDRQSMWARLRGVRQPSVAGEHAGEMVRRVSGSRLSTIGAALLVAHGLLLFVNALYGWIDPPLLINASIMGIGLLALPGRRARATAGAHATGEDAGAPAESMPAGSA